MNGFVAYCHHYSRNGNGWHAGDIHDIDLEGTVEALAWLRDQPSTAANVGLYGWSRGGEHALLVTSLMARDGISPLPDAVAVHAPSDTIVGAFIASTADPKGADTWDPSLRSWRWEGTSEGLLPSTPIEIERYPGPIFISHGEADTVWSVASTHRLRDRLAAAGRAAEVHVYPDSDHVLDPATENLNNERLVAFFKRTLNASENGNAEFR